MLVFRKQWRTLSGLLAGAAILIAAATAALGFQIWPAYFKLLLSLARLQSVMDFPMYVDAIAFWTMLLRKQHRIIEALVAISFLTGGSLLIRAWIRSANRTVPENARLVWAATIDSTLFLNLYVPYYDTLL